MRESLGSFSLPENHFKHSPVIPQVNNAILNPEPSVLPLCQATDVIIRGRRRLWAHRIALQAGRVVFLDRELVRKRDHISQLL